MSGASKNGLKEFLYVNSDTFATWMWKKPCVETAVPASIKISDMRGAMTEAVRIGNRMLSFRISRR